MKIISLNVGRPHIVIFGGHRYSTAIRRQPTDQPMQLTALGLQGDRVADSRHHGGPDQALCAYPAEHYASVETFLGRSLDVPSFGENLTTSGLLESQVCIGDMFQIADATVQVSAPRQPCSTLARNLGDPRIIEWIAVNGCCGFYLRVLQPGIIAVGSPVELLERPRPEMRVADVLKERYLATPDREKLSQWVEAPELAESYRRVLGRRFKGGSAGGQ